MRCSVVACVITAACGADPGLPQPPRTDTGDESFDRIVAPILLEWCLGCHSAATRDVYGAPAWLDLDTPEAVRANAAAIVAAIDPAAARMPPGGGMPEETRQRLVAWLTR